MKHIFTLILGITCFCMIACSSDEESFSAGTATVPDTEESGGNTGSSSGTTPGTSSKPDYSNLTASNHPRVVFTDDDFKAMADLYEAGTNQYFNKMHEIILDIASTTLTDSDLERVLTGKRLLTVCRNAEKRILACAYAYKTTGDERYLAQAEKDITAVCNFSDWNCPTHTLDVGEMAPAVGLGYDWLYNDLSSSTKSLARKALNDFAFTPVLNGQMNNDIYTITNNWNAVCNGGLICAALAVYEDNQSVAQTIIDKGLAANILGQEEGYYPDGIYPEGYSYWNYGTIYETLLLTAMETATGSDNGLSNIEGFSKTGQYVLNMLGSSGYCFNYSDCSQSSSPCIALWYFAWKYGDTSVLYLEKDNVSKYKSADEVRLLPLVAWFTSKVDVGAISAPTQKLFTGEGETPVVLIHDTWTMDENDKFLGIKGGLGTSSHAHLDAGSFVYDDDGIRWASDLGMESYNQIESVMSDFWQMKDGSGRWTVFRYNNFNHNTITVNDAYFKVAGLGYFTEIFDSDNMRGATIDLSGPLNGEVYSATRSVYMEGDDLVVKDNIVALTTKDANVRWTMVTQAVPTIEYGAVTLKRNNRTRYLTSSGNAVEWQTWSTKGDNSWDSDNSGYYECGYTMTVKAGQSATVTIRLTPNDPLL